MTKKTNKMYSNTHNKELIVPYVQCVYNMTLCNIQNKKKKSNKQDDAVLS